MYCLCINKVYVIVAVIFCECAIVRRKNIDFNSKHNEWARIFMFIYIISELDSGFKGSKDKFGVNDL